MTRRRKRIEEMRKRPPRMRFRDVEAVLHDFGYEARRVTGSHVWFAKTGCGPLPIPKSGGWWVTTVYLDQICEVLGLDEFDLEQLDDVLGPED